MYELANILANRSWLRCNWPFPYIVARNVFKANFYNALTEQLQEILARGLSDTPDGQRFSRNIPNYDSYGMAFSQTMPDPLGLFLSPSWRDMISGLFGIDPTPYVFAGSHHHAVGSETGFIHNDCNPVWFPRTSGDNIKTPNYELCSYKTGVGPLPESEKAQVVRGAVVLFFLLNDGWRSGDGGETGLYASARSRVSEPDACWPPINNSLVAYECTPNSFHTFLTNTRLPRTSIIMWVHRTMEAAVKKFGEANLERWKT